jgi:hypothetical protein
MVYILDVSVQGLWSIVTFCADRQVSQAEAVRKIIEAARLFVEALRVLVEAVRVIVEG